MTTSFPATYYSAAGHPFAATVFVSPVTITIRFRDQEQAHELYWLTSDLTGFDEQPFALHYRNKDGGAERLLVQDTSLQLALKTALRHHKLFAPAHKRVLSNIWVKLGILLGLILALLLMAYLWWIPALGDRIARHFDKQSEIDMGEKMYQAMASDFPIDQEKTRLLNQFYQELHFAVDYPVQITVVTSDISNAFAIPGGHIVVYDAILDRMKTPEELAALLAHEASHVALRHSLRNIFRMLSRKMFLSLITGGQNDLAAAAINNADELKGLQYSRSLETEADDNGLQLMTRSHIDVMGMERLMELLQKESNSAEPPALLSTHPIFSDRIDNIRKRVKELPVVSTSNPKLKEIFKAIYE